MHVRDINNNENLKNAFSLNKISYFGFTILSLFICLLRQLLNLLKNEVSSWELLMADILKVKTMSGYSFML